MAISRNGVTLTPREQKKYVLERTGWTSEKYNKEYDKLRNRVRNYERATGIPRGDINAADLLARHALRKSWAERTGQPVKDSELYKAVLNAPTISTGKKLSKRTRERLEFVHYEFLVGRGITYDLTVSEETGEIKYELIFDLQNAYGQFGALLAASETTRANVYRGFVSNGRQPLSAGQLDKILRESGKTVNEYKKAAASRNAAAGVGGGIRPETI